MSFRVPNESRVRVGQLASDESYGNNGCFIVGAWRRLQIIASDGEGWEHVSVSILESKNTPTWDEMCTVKDIFWEGEDVVMQLHPKRSEYVNHYPGCLHLWRPTDKTIPTPPMMMVGPKT